MKVKTVTSKTKTKLDLKIMSQAETEVASDSSPEVIMWMQAGYQSKNPELLWLPELRIKIPRNFLEVYLGKTPTRELSNDRITMM